MNYGENHTTSNNIPNSNNDIENDLNMNNSESEEISNQEEIIQITDDNINREELNEEINRLSFSTINRLLNDERNLNTIQQNVINISSQYQQIFSFIISSNLSFAILLLFLYFFQYKTAIIFYLLNLVIYIGFSLCLQKIDTNPPQLNFTPNILVLFCISFFLLINFYFQPILSRVTFLSFTTFNKTDMEYISTILYYVLYSDLILRSVTIFAKVSSFFLLLIKDSYTEVQPKIFLFIDTFFDIYRSVIPIPLWYYYFQNFLVAGFISFFYLSMKFISILAKMRFLCKLIYPNQVGRKVTESEILERGEKCSICMEDKFTDPVMLSCNHIYCVECIEKWVDINSFCPLCRVVIHSHRESQNMTTSFIYVF
eukprot:TRINITY_DN4122_c0_g1_i2.p1 TRINITY_DN4122_c0_g1~~TRINITY_DN4122_c0_g1_i2.p1  ORF type:complete len:370 (-),score=74.16 TRINITY_DN4122_c0_g1_i2:81-1190(-)